MSCDKCGLVTTKLKPIAASYQTSDVKVLCDDCGDKADIKLNKLVALKIKATTDINHWIQQEMALYYESEEEEIQDINFIQKIIDKFKIRKEENKDDV